MKKVLLATGGLVALLALVGVVLVVTVDPVALVVREKDRVSAAASEKLGRAVTVGRVDGSVLPVLRATLRDVALAGPDPEGPPQIEAGLVEVRFSLWRALTSLGKDLEVDSVVLEGAKVRAARDAQGRWDFQDVLDKLASAPAPEGEAKEPADLSFLEGARISRVSIEDASVHLDDAQLGRPLTVSRLSVALKDIALERPIEATLRATLEDGAKKTPVSLTAKLARLPKDLVFSPLPDVEAKIDVGELHVGPWGGLLPKDALAPADGTLSLSLQARATDDLQTLLAKAKVKAAGLTLRQGNARGRPLDADVDVELAVDQKAPRYEVKRLSWKGTGVDLGGTLDARGLSPADLAEADVKATVQDLSRLLAVLPPGAAALPEELSLEGPLSAHVKGNASEVDVALSLDDAAVRWADSFAKQKGRPLNLALKGMKTQAALNVPTFTLVVDAAKLDGSLSLPTKEGAPLIADVKTGRVPFSSLQELLPPVKRALTGGDKVEGHFELSVRAGAKGGSQDAKAFLVLDGFDAQLAKTTIQGDGSLLATVTPAGERMHGALLARFDGLELRSRGEDGALLLDKPKGMPLRLDAELVRSPSRVEIQRALLEVAGTRVSANGTATGLDTGKPVLDVDLGNVDVAFDDLRRAVPGAGALPAGGRLKGQVKLTGAPSALQTVKVDAQGLDLAFGKTRVKGRVSVTDLDAPVLDVDLPEVSLWFDDLRDLSDAVPKGGSFEGGVKLAGRTDALSTMKADLRIADLRVGRDRMKGTAKVEDLDRPRFTFDLSSDALDVDALLAALEGDAPAEKEAKPKAPPVEENPHGLSRSTRETLAKVSGKGTLRIARAKVKGIPVERFVGQLVMKNGSVRFDSLDFDLYGGRVSAAGTLLDLPAEFTGYQLKLGIQGIDLGSALRAHTKVGRVFGGKANQSLDVKGRGLSLKDLVATLEGPIRIETRALKVATLDLLGPIFAPLKDAAKKSAGLKLASAPKREGTTLEDVNAWMKFHAGRLALEKPLSAKTRFGEVVFDGGAFLDSRLDLLANVKLSPATISSWTRGKVKPKQAIPIPLKIGGTWDKPEVTGVDAKALLAAVLGGAVTGVVDDAKEKAEAEAQKLAARAEAEAEKAKREAEARAKAEADKARRAADDAKKKAEAEARKQADEARKKAEAAKKKAEEEARKKAEAAKKKAEEEAKKKAAAAKKKAEEEAKKLLGF